MISRHRLVEIKRVKELPLSTRSLPIMDRSRESPFVARLNESFATQSPESGQTDTGFAKSALCR
jgi:hypothetical protein